MARFALGLAALLLALPAYAQEGAFSVRIHDAPLAEALDRFAESTGLAVAYRSELVDGRRASCVARQRTSDAVLRCILDGTDLDFYQLSSGTYVIVRAARLPDAPGVVRGVVVDASTGLPLPDAFVYLPGAAAGTYANAAGLFALGPLDAGAYEYQATHVGYRPGAGTVRPQPGGHVEIVLEPEPLPMEPVIIDGVQRTRPSEGLGHATLEGDALLRDASALGAADVLHSADAMAGVRLSEATADLHVQAGAPGEHQIRLDGSPVFVSPHLAGLVGPFSPLSIGRLTVHKAGFGAGHGSHTSGVVLAEHKLRSTAGTTLDARLDPLSLDLYGSAQMGEATGRPITAMAAVRQSLWGLMRPPELDHLLAEWSTPDLFLVEGPIALAERTRDAQLAAERYRALPTLATQPELSAQDAHAALHARLGPLSTLEASAYRGASRLGTQPTRDAGAIGLRLDDRYDWVNQTGQVRYQTVWGSRTLAGVRLRGSQYRLDHDYALPDTLRIFNRTPSEAADYADVDLRRRVSQAPVRDENHVTEAALEVTLGHALRARHYLDVQAAAIRTDSRFDFTTTSGLLLFDADGGDVSDSLLTARRRVSQRYGATRFTASVQDRYQATAAWSLEAGIRFTHLPHHRRTFAEPRLAVRYDGAGAWAGRLAAGVYRQFLSQHDVTSANLGALLPALRFWMPVDSTLAPPRAYHAAAEGLWTRGAWTLRAEAYGKRHARLYAFADPTLYTFTPGEPDFFGPGSEGAPARPTLTPPPAHLQREYLAPGRGYAVGGGLSAERTARRWTGRAALEVDHARRRVAGRFGGRLVPIPWNEPLRLRLDATWRPRPAIAVLATWRSVWGRAFGFRQVYYDYVGVLEGAYHLAADRPVPITSGGVAPDYGPEDLRRPEAHRLPPLHRLDLAAVVTPRLGGVRTHLRLGLLNVLGRANVAEWRLRYDADADTFRREARLLTPRLPAASIRVSW